jgi:hypothetical protein
MPTPIDHGFPVKRPAFIEAAEWIGSDQDLNLVVSYKDILGQPRQRAFPCRNLVTGAEPGQICLPSAATVDDLEDTAVIAHVRAATFISGTIAGSKEWKNAFTNQEQSQDFQLAVGTCKVIDVRMIDQTTLEFDVKKGSSGPTKTITTDHPDLSRYTCDADSAVLVIPGSVKKQYPTYEHDSDSKILTQAQRDNVVSYVLGLAIWMLAWLP